MKKIKNANKGFTLLELLVVVLIIGILAAIALPQYRNAVRRARVAEAKIALRALSDAADRYFLRHDGAGWYSLEDLDVQVSQETNNWFFDFLECSDYGCRVIAFPKWENGYTIQYGSLNYEDPLYRGLWSCQISSDDFIEKCKSLGGQECDFDADHYKL